MRSRTLFGLVAILAPPAAAVWLWARRDTRPTTKLLGTFALVGLTLLHLMIFFDLRIERDGTGLWPLFSFGSREAHYESLERHREELVAPAGGGLAASGDVPEIQGSRYWIRFRGPRMDGLYDQMPIATDWPAEGLELLWKQPIGGGYASFVVADGTAYTIEQRRDEEVVSAYEVVTGREIWTHSWNAEFRESMGGDGPRATPTWHEGLVYALGATGELRALDARTGEPRWRTNILSDNGAENLQWGMAASPLIVGERVIVLPGGPKGRSVVAYHRLTGEKRWSALDDPQAYTSPMLVTLAGRRQILVVSRERAMGLAPEDGALLWEYPWETSFGVNAAQPLILDDRRLFLSAGYGHGAAVVEIRESGSGLSARAVWENHFMKNRFNSSVLHEGYVYGLDEGILACLDARTGERMWKGGRYGYGQALLASGHLIVLTETGDLVLVEATPESHREVSRFTALSGKTWNNPALSDGILLVRNTTEMAAFRIGVE